MADAAAGAPGRAPGPARPGARPEVSRPAPRWLFGIAAAAHPAALPAPAAAPAGGHGAAAPAPGAAGPRGGGGWPGGGDGGGAGGAGGGAPARPQPFALLGAAPEAVVLTLASFAVTKLAYVRLTKLFREQYIADKGVDVRFRLTFAGSGVQARAVIDGLPADLVALALPLDVQKIADSGLLSPNWRKAYPLRSVVCETTVALVVRQGNPRGIRSWEDLLQPGLQVIVANPKTAGVARWIFLALWGSHMRRGDAAAREYVTKVFDNVLIQPRDAREASDVFYRQRLGDVLLTYENEVVLTNQVYGAGKALPYVVPSPNVRIECPLALVDRVLDGRPPAARAAAHDFARFLFTPEAQVEFGKVGFRTNRKLCKTPAEHLAGQPAITTWDVDSKLGGWGAAQRKFFDAGRSWTRSTQTAPGLELPSPCAGRCAASMATPTLPALDPASKLFAAGPVELYEVVGKARTQLKAGVPLEVFSASPSRAYPMLSAVLDAGGVRWSLALASHTMRSLSDAGEPTFIFSGVKQRDVDTFYCVIFKRNHAAHELEVLEQVLGKLSTLHVSSSVKKNAVPFNLPLPQIDPKTINEIMRKGAEDTQMLLKQAGDAANAAFLAAADMHKKYAPKPAERPVEVAPDVKDKIGKTKQAAAAGAAVAKGVATGMQAATAEIGTSLVQTVTSAAGKDKAGEGGKVPEPLVAVGGIGMELLRDIAAVRDAVLGAAGSAWAGARAATVDVMEYQYGGEVAAVAADSCDVVEGIGSMGVAMRMAQPTQVVLTSAKDTSGRIENQESAAEGAALAKERQQLEDERAALEREKAALAAELARLAGKKPSPQAAAAAPAPAEPQQQQRKGGWPFSFA
ncbi:sbpA [Scenedesmus sp. PABB004]|nr:sbpA [Scenedesmus sp. PABB004]